MNNDETAPVVGECLYGGVGIRQVGSGRLAPAAGLVVEHRRAHRDRSGIPHKSSHPPVTLEHQARLDDAPRRDEHRWAEPDFRSAELDLPDVGGLPALKVERQEAAKLRVP